MAIDSTPPRRRVLFVASECAPYARTGGLGEVVAALSKELARLGHDVRVALPLYASLDRARYALAFERSSCVHMPNGEEAWVSVHRAALDERVTAWFLEYQRFFGRRGIYDEPSGEYGDNAFRFGLLSRAALQAALDADWVPDVVHVHDWPSALAAFYVKRWGSPQNPFAATASVLTVHNVGYQGVYHASARAYLGIGDTDWTPDRFEDHGQINLLKGGIALADAITTVSPTHARELLTPSGGRGLAPCLVARERDLFGILNGIDEDEWDPARDRYIPEHFDAGHLEGKAFAKHALQRFFRLEERADLPLFGIVTRLAEQKGIGLLTQALPAALDRMAMQFVALGNGDLAAEEFLRRLERAYPGRVGIKLAFSNELSHLIEAGSDFFLMPSLYEPCGLNQMYSMRYGTLPIVRATGGLDDTVESYDAATGRGTGFKFRDATAGALFDTIGWAVATWFDRPPDIERLRRQAMAKHFSWSESARRYEDVYEHALRRRSELDRDRS